MSIDHYQFSIEKLAANQGSWPEIARDCDVSYSWLCKFANNKIPNASYIKVRRIADYLRVIPKTEPGRREQDRRVSERRKEERRIE